MPRWMIIVFWIGVVMLVDAAADFWGLAFWQKRFPALNVRKIAMAELAAALVILLAYFAVRALAEWPRP